MLVWLNSRVLLRSPIVVLENGKCEALLAFDFSTETRAHLSLVMQVTAPKLKQRHANCAIQYLLRIDACSSLPTLISNISFLLIFNSITLDITALVGL
uniref:Secreted protein n=1 Tax=Heterorhabditis bacteriophora TaxID=37862 RepID=A0A1I7XJH5_HETBA